MVQCLYLLLLAVTRPLSLLLLVTKNTTQFTCCLESYQTLLAVDMEMGSFPLLFYQFQKVSPLLLFLLCFVYDP